MFAILLLFSNLLIAASFTEAKICVVKANGHRQDDTPNILEAIQSCGYNGKIIFPENQSYWIATRLHAVLRNVEIEWRGQWTVSEYIHQQE